MGRGGSDHSLSILSLFLFNATGLSALKKRREEKKKNRRCVTASVTHRTTVHNAYRTEKETLRKKRCADLGV